MVIIYKCCTIRNPIELKCGEVLRFVEDKNGHKNWLRLGFAIPVYVRYVMAAVNETI